MEWRASDRTAGRSRRLVRDLRDSDRPTFQFKKEALLALPTSDLQMAARIALRTATFLAAFNKIHARPRTTSHFYTFSFFQPKDGLKVWLG